MQHTVLLASTVQAGVCIAALLANACFTLLKRLSVVKLMHRSARFFSAEYPFTRSGNIVELAGLRRLAHTYDVVWFCVDLPILQWIL